MTTVLSLTADPRVLRGRGAVSNAAGRYERHSRVLLDDGWGADAAPPLQTQIHIDASRSIICNNKSPDISYNRTLNPYRGCEHGCIYCFARPTHAYLGLSPGTDFESHLFVKPNAAALLAKELSAPGYVPQTIAIGTNTDPYQPIERRLKIMRSVLEVLRDHRHPVGIITKSALVTRDLDILSEMAALGLVRVALSITTLDRSLARAMEPRAPTPAKRLEALAALSAAGIPTAVMFAPIIPALNDSEMETVLAAARDLGARDAGYVLLRLPLEIKDLFREWLAVHRPDTASHVVSLIRQMRGGKEYDAEWHTRMSGRGPYAQMLAHRFRMATRRLGLDRHTELRADRFTRPAKPGDQLNLF